MSWRVRRSRLRPLLIAAVAAWGRAASGSNGRGLLPALGGCNGGVAPLPSAASAMRWREVERLAEGQTCNITWLASLPKRSLRRFWESGQAQSFRSLPPRLGTPRHWLQPMLKCALAKDCGTLRPYPRRSLSPQAPVCPARKPVTRGGMPAPVGGGSRRPALSDKDAALLRVIGVGWIVRRRPGGLIPKELYSSLPVCCRHLPHPAASKNRHQP